MSIIKCFFVEALDDGSFRDNSDGHFIAGSQMVPFNELASGAMWYADWYTRRGPDGHHLIVKTPGGCWHVDGRANNCTRLDDDEHYCWVRHGQPPKITVDKNGNTCGCGCSIGQGAGYRDYHGFLRDGELIDA